VAKSKEEFEKEVKREMKKLGVYKPQYVKIIKIFSGMLSQYQNFEEQFEESDYALTEAYTNKAGATNERKIPLYTAMESLRKDLATYSTLLCLNPKATQVSNIKLTKGKGKDSKLTAVLKKLDR